ncbi:MAG: GNAT family N-acetyltransferase, partial [Bacteroidia bacterium]|nr:GNAT family N-acetyltransferase [Bacteroidia bacterium]
MNISSANLSMAKELATLFDAYRVFYRKEPDPIAALSFIEDRLENNDAVIFVAQDTDEKIVGFTQLYPSFSSTKMQRLWILNDLFVLPEFRGQGISKLLIDRAKLLCKESDACGLLLETETSNIIGNRLY